MDEGLNLPRVPWWQRPELLVVVVVCATAVAIRPTAMPLVGEETRRAIYSRHILEGGDWAVMPRWESFYDRPPGQYWQIAALAKLTGNLDPLTVRLGSIIATTLTALVIFWFGSHTLSRAGAFVAAVAYPTMGQVLQIGRRAETEALFVLLLSGALLVWYHGYRSRWKPAWTWFAGYLIVTMAAMTKGTQAPVTFIGTTVLFLLWRRDWRMLLRPSHALGIGLFIALVALWQTPFYQRTSLHDAISIWFGQVMRRTTFNPAAFIKHLVEFPFEVFGGMLPWSVLLLGALRRRVRPSDDEGRSMMWFMLIAIVVTALPVWVVAGARHRYAMPLYPLACVLIGLTVDRLAAVESDRLWRTFTRGMAVLSIGAAVGFVGVTIAARSSNTEVVQTLRQPMWVAACFLALSIAVAAVIWPLAPRKEPRPIIITATALALLIGVLFSGPVLNAHIANANFVGDDIAALHQRLGDDVRLVSFDLIYHRFAYYWHTPIRQLPWPKAADDAAGVTWFAYTQQGRKARPELPFRWEKVAELNQDNTCLGRPQTVVVVGRRLSEADVSN